RLTESNNYTTMDIGAVKFVNASGGDYRLAAGSPAIDKGTNTSKYGVSFDLGNGGRPAGAAHDIGAFEANSGGVNPGPEPEPEPNPDPEPVAQKLATFTLINADTDKEIGTLTNGYVIDFAAIGTRNLSV